MTTSATVPHRADPGPGGGRPAPPDELWRWAATSGMAPIAHGDDHGGSIRYPAQVCGVLGLRPTVGLVPRPVRVAPVRDVGIGAAEVVEARAGVLTRIRPRGRGTDGPDDVSRGGVR